MLKGVFKSVSNPLCSLMTRSYDEGIVTDNWKLANVIPIFKKGDRYQLSNYRQVAHLSYSKKLQKMIGLFAQLSLRH